MGCAALRTLAVAAIMAAGCTAQPGTAQPGTAQPGTAQPGTGPPARSRAPIRAAAGPARYLARATAVPAQMQRRMVGVSWRPGCPVGLGQLRLLTVRYWGFDHAVHQGQLIVNQTAVSALTRAFGLLFAARYPIRQIQPADAFGGSDERSMLADNTSAFNCRRVRGTSAWSMHAYGLAVDINPFENPEVLGNGAVDPPAAKAWADRSRRSPAMIRHGDAAWLAFISVGWKWGGDWASPTDYQHFSANGQ